MKTRQATLLALLVPAMALVTACNGDDNYGERDMATSPVDTAPAAPADGTTVPGNATTPPPAAAGNAGAGLTFEQMDKNADGGISPDELASTDALYAHFAAADADGNGQLSAGEIVAFRSGTTAPPPQ